MFNMDEKALADVIENTAHALLGSRNLHSINPLNDSYNEEFLKNNHGPSLLHMAFNIYRTNNDLSYEDMHARMEKLLAKGITSYPFEAQDEEVEIRNGLIVLRKVQGLSDRQNKLYKMRATYADTWEVNPKNLMTLYATKSEINFFTYIYSSFFRVDRTLRKHLISSLPNINFPSVLLESYCYIKSVTSMYPNTKMCPSQMDNYNNHASKNDIDNFFVSEKGIIIDFTMDTKARNSKSYEPLLYMYLAFPICCDDNDTIWETINYNKMYKIVSDMLSSVALYKGRLSTSIIISDLKKAHSLILKDSVEFNTELDMKAKTAEDNILFLMSTNISNDLWEATKDLPEDWISLL
jgi:hypothetical protein